jgi:hypothetical protein
MDDKPEAYNAFCDLIETLQSFYPRTRRDDALERAKRWFKPLARFDLEVIEQAIDRMPHVSPEWFPSLGVLIAECRAVAGQEARKEQDQTKIERQDIDDRNYDRLLETMPTIPQIQDEWVKEAKNEAERLGRQWIVDSKRKGRRSDSVLPQDEARARIAALMATMGQDDD